MPAMIDALITRPVRSLATACAIFDRRGVDAGVRIAADTASLISRAAARIAEPRLDGTIDWTADGWLRLAYTCRDRLPWWIGSAPSSVLPPKRGAQRRRGRYQPTWRF
jgi:hypothetical protein